MRDTTRTMRWWMLALLLPLLGGCGYNRIQQQDEAVKAQWSQVLNQYQRRADLIPNLVNTVRGYAAQEERVLTEVTNARARVGSVQMSADDAADPAKLAEAQGAASCTMSEERACLANCRETYGFNYRGQCTKDVDGTVSCYCIQLGFS